MPSVTKEEDYLNTQQSKETGNDDREEELIYTLPEENDNSEIPSYDKLAMEKNHTSDPTIPYDSAQRYMSFKVNHQVKGKWSMCPQSTVLYSAAWICLTIILLLASGIVGYYIGKASCSSFCPSKQEFSPPKENGTANSTAVSGKAGARGIDHTTPATVRSFIVMDEPETWKEASLQCGRRNAYLAEVHNKKIFNRFSVMMNSQTIKGLWLGGRDSEKEGYRWFWQYSLVPVSFNRFWHECEPNGNGDENCLCMMISGSQAGFNDCNCSLKLPYVCQIDEPITSKSIAVNRSYVPRMSHFVRINERMTWDMAFEYCKLRRTRLVELYNEKSKQRLMRYLYKCANVDHPIYVGATDREQEGHFEWKTSKTPVQNLTWRIYQPDNYRGIEHCVTIDAGIQGTLNDVPCTDRNPFICERI